MIHPLVGQVSLFQAPSVTSVVSKTGVIEELLSARLRNKASVACARASYLASSLAGCRPAPGRAPRTLTSKRKRGIGYLAEKD